jgi:hypothetical protein
LRILEEAEIGRPPELENADWMGSQGAARCRRFPVRRVRHDEFLMTKNLKKAAGSE